MGDMKDAGDAPFRGEVQLDSKVTLPAMCPLTCFAPNATCLFLGVAQLQRAWGNLGDLFIVGCSSVGTAAVVYQADLFASFAFFGGSSSV